MRPPVPPLASATLRFVNVGEFQAPGAARVVRSPGDGPLESVRRFVVAQLETVRSGVSGDLQEVDCPAFDELQQYMRSRHAVRQLCPGREGAVTPATDDDILEMAVESTLQAAFFGVRQLIPMRARLRRCARVECSHWFVAADLRRTLCSDHCKNLNRPAARAAWMRGHRKVLAERLRGPKVKQRA